MKFGYTILYVPDVAASLAFFEKAFGLTRRFFADTGDYGELETGATTLSFASQDLALSHHAAGYVFASGSDKPLGVEIALVAEDVEAAHAVALAAGATELAPPKAMPWGQTVSFIRCPDGTLVELCTPVGG
ncbi:VOC family protein [Azospirillum picis]|uniref:Catechol 2,3-dioxygenase-like lactoylglutathione lyase family enzyme n=1 Tax=Azospirillum picis TaxID=488438 RepID=A0ABU0MFI8_9PROT|nr:VOC family protein [Azospirillum picis]MBP2298757.1 catechol 2,3-dioxygenase-like lactoylglutathione lyase family enzyme [Azospirillum picis]MDQ0532194.1 catechol 2,3-dioxygenase-like lactoylglutathione lyase family enzyme [Azospirillum picis]